ncbi:MAG TPA: PspC domain-containing protein [Acidimicrobiales bacterium]|nr:PspC domain-containing protein [Acidimicrobiales bacterium]
METDTNKGASWTGAADNPDTPTDTAPPWATLRPLVRPRAGRMIAGVAAAVADYLAVDVAVVRIVIAVLCLVGGAGVPLYVAGWLLIPEEGAEMSIAAELLQWHHNY